MGFEYVEHFGTFRQRADEETPAATIVADWGHRRQALAATLVATMALMAAAAPVLVASLVLVGALK
jgi:hypothetical protein